MMIFVSYARQDHDLGELRAINKSVSRWGNPYIDDLHNTGIAQRLQNVVRALQAADRFILVASPNYLKTPWTCAEYRIAITRHPLLTDFMVAGILVKVFDFIAEPVPQEDMINVHHRASSLIQRDRSLKAAYVIGLLSAKGLHANCLVRAEQAIGTPAQPRRIKSRRCSESAL